jgi:UDP-glucose 4-epimerase
VNACQPGTWHAYNVGSGHLTTIRDVIHAVERVTGRPVPRRTRTPRTASRPQSHQIRTHLAAKFLDNRENRQRRVDSALTRVASTTPNSPT